MANISTASEICLSRTGIEAQCDLKVLFFVQIKHNDLIYIQIRNSIQAIVKINLYYIWFNGVSFAISSRLDPIFQMLKSIEQARIK